MNDYASILWNRGRCKEAENLIIKNRSHSLVSYAAMMEKGTLIREKDINYARELYRINYELFKGPGNLDMYLKLLYDDDKKLNLSRINYECCFDDYSFMLYFQCQLALDRRKARNLAKDKMEYNMRTRNSDIDNQLLGPLYLYAYCLLTGIGGDVDREKGNELRLVYNSMSKNHKMKLNF